MSYEEKGTWVYLVVSAIVYVVYAVVLLGQGVPLPETDWISPLLWSIGVAIVAAIVVRIVLEIVLPSDSQRSDARDRSISRYGGRYGHPFVVAGALGALVLALVAADYFWIANAVYLGFVLSAVASSVASIIAYRRGVPAW